MRRRTTERWQEIDALFVAALDVDAAARAAFLARAARDDPELHAAVAALLESSARSASFLETPLLRLPDDLWREATDGPEDGEPIERANAGIHRYRLIRAVGRGGMGTVYLAERADGAFEQRVALKLLRRGIDTDDILERFRHERQILASLNHPHIARLLDGGAAEDGRPYLVMEFVEGQPITAFCDAARLTVEARLRLFCAVARAVQYAHGNLVVHRDLKPSNILVTGDGEPKLLDFGIAKVLGPELADPPLTRTGARLLTPEYASPEQLRGEPVGTAADVYQLGVLLFRLLSGQHPPAAIAPSAAERGELPAELPAPSDAVQRDPDAAATAAAMGYGSAERLRRRLRGDLDNIVRMALREEPERRYASAGQLADDVERHLADRPVVARPETTLYRARTFVRRNRAGVGAGVGLAVLLAAYAVTVTVDARRIAGERDLARREAAELEQHSYYLIELFWGGDPREPMREPETGRLLLEEAHQRVIAMDERPRVQARMLDVLGRVYYMLGEYDRAGPLLERAVANQRASHAGPHPELANSLGSLALLRDLEGDHAAAERLSREAVAIYRGLGRTEYPQYATILKNLAHTLVARGKVAEAEALARESLALRRASLGDEHEEVATSLSTLGSILERRGGLPEAVAAHREALRLRRRLYPPEHALVAASLHDLGIALRLSGRRAEAESLLRQADRIRRRILGDHHPDTRAGARSLAVLLRERGRLAEADSVWGEPGAGGSRP